MSPRLLAGLVGLPCRPAAGALCGTLASQAAQSGCLLCGLPAAPPCFPPVLQRVPHAAALPLAGRVPVPARGDGAGRARRQPRPARWAVRGRTPGWAALPSACKLSRRCDCSAPRPLQLPPAPARATWRTCCCCVRCGRTEAARASWWVGHPPGGVQRRVCAAAPPFTAALLLPAQVLPFRQACEEQADRLAPIVAQLDGKLVGWRR